MTSTSVHLPPAIVEQLDRLAAQRGTSRNRVILQASEDLLAEHRGDWPSGFFDSALPAEDLTELRAGAQQMEAAIIGSRRVAITMGGGVATANARDFQKLQGLRVEAWRRE